MKLQRFRILTGFVILLAFAPQSNAQLIKAVGVKAAYTSAFQNFNYTNFSSDFVRRPGVNAAIFVEWLDLPILSVITQIEYAQRGMRWEAMITINTPKPVRTEMFSNRVDYVSLPVLVKLSLPLGIITPYLIGGPRYDRMVGFKSDKDAFKSLYEEFNKSMYGYSAGAGISFDPWLPVFVEFRFNRDLKDSYASPYLTVRNESYDVWLGVAL